MKCIHTKANGKKCRADAMINSSYCWIHSPEVSEEQKQKASAKGGKANAHFSTNGSAAGIMPVTLNYPADIPQLLIDTIKQLREGTMHVRIGTAIGYVSYILLKSYEISGFEERLKALEEKAREINQNRKEESEYDLKEYILEDEES